MAVLSPAKLLTFALTTALAAASCGKAAVTNKRSARATGGPGDQGADEPSLPSGAKGAGPTTPEARAAAEAAAASAPTHLALTSRSLTVAEIDETLSLVLADDSRPAYRLLGDDARGPFDTRVDLLDEKRLNANNVSALESMAADVAARLIADVARKTKVLGCTAGPTASDVEACLRIFLAKAGRGLLRRSLAADEIERFAAAASAAAVQDGNADSGVSLLVMALLQHPEFLFRLESGTPLGGGLRKLSDREWLTRTSLALTGTAPESDWILAVERNGVADAVARRAIVETIWKSPRTLKQLDRFHAMWLSYEKLPHATALVQSMRIESKALLEHVAFANNSPWIGLLTSPKTYVDASLAAHYGLPAPAGGAPGWVDYGTSGRAGILSQGSFLSLGAKQNGETSPTIRGKLVRERLFCQIVPPPPPNVNVDEPPESTDGSPCKKARYSSHASSGACAGCHKLMDPIGFGLEAFDAAGRPRATDKDLPECPIDGKGEIAGTGAFSGPGELGRLLVEKDIIAGCFVEKLWEYLDSRETTETTSLAAMQAAFKSSGYRLKDFLIDFFASDAAIYADAEDTP